MGGGRARVRRRKGEDEEEESLKKIIDKITKRESSAKK